MKYLINIWTEYAGSEEIYKIEADNIDKVYPLAADRAYENFIESGSYDAVIEDNPDLTEDQMYTLLDDSYHYSVEEFKGTEEEWNKYEDL